MRALFDKHGIQAVEQQHLRGCNYKVLVGYYKCDNSPQIGFSFGDGKSFDIEPSAFKLAHNGGNNCTATIVGVPGEDNLWIVGQAWFQGKYVDHNSGGKTFGVANLKDTGDGDEI